ncbi:MAG: hypothetical protein DI598_11955 [Pseudopedobacter saltans]|uniref:DUF2400 domain-containing protein n=1 Tax=Pseudopedobacter saltans TaxID=151895 RepID=A0A2W5GTD3_9SPHI|nr:MAG: hypothetical protein DI598_11955 [Pseudopedobacter saltans]
MQNIKKLLDEKVKQYNHPDFIPNDPISIPHLFTKKKDIEIAGLFAAIFAWGNRTIIINKSKELMELMDMQPYDFIMNHQESDLQNLMQFKHRTFNDTDLLYCIDFMKRHFTQYNSLEEAFFPSSDMNVEAALNHFQAYFFSHPDAPHRTRKHIPSPVQKSACKPRRAPCIHHGARLASIRSVLYPAPVCR